MRILVAVFAASLALGLAPGALAAAGNDDARTASPRQTGPGAVELSREQQLDALYETLTAAKNEEAANAAENSIAANPIKAPRE